MKTSIKRSHLILAAALFGTLLGQSPVFATDSESMKMEGKKGEMMQNEEMSAQEMIKKGNEMITQGKEMKKKGMMKMKKDMKKDGTMKDEKMMKENEMKGNKME